MRKHRFRYSQTLAIWEAYKKKCLYCEEPIAFKDLHIDHIVPEHLVNRPDEFEALKQELKLGDEFLLNDFPNWAASHHGCNSRKANRIFRRLTYFLEIAEPIGHKARQRWQRYEAANNTNKVMSGLRVMIENGTLTRQEILDFANAVVRNADTGMNNPVIVCFGMNSFQVIGLPEDIPEPFWARCDWLERDLLASLEHFLNCKPRIMEDSRDGEILSVRVGLWDLDLDRLDAYDPRWWEILEVGLHTQIYDEFVPTNTIKP
jgi:hypothetical protein